MRRLTAAAALSLVAFVPLALPGPLSAVTGQGGPQVAAQQPDQVADEWDGLPEGPGRDEVFGLCGACHSLKLVKQQGLSRDSWEETLVWMVEEQDMPELDQETLTLVLNYLAEHYGIDVRNKN